MLLPLIARCTWPGAPSDLGYSLRLLRLSPVTARRDVVGALHAWQAPHALGTGGRSAVRGGPTLDRRPPTTPELSTLAGGEDASAAGIYFRRSFGRNHRRQVGEAVSYVLMYRTRRSATPLHDRAPNGRTMPLCKFPEEASYSGSGFANLVTAPTTAVNAMSPDRLAPRHPPVS
jgi:hypothetical protein